MDVDEVGGIKKKVAGTSVPMISRDKSRSLRRSVGAKAQLVQRPQTCNGLKNYHNVL